MYYLLLSMIITEWRYGTGPSRWTRGTGAGGASWNADWRSINRNTRDISMVGQSDLEFNYSAVDKPMRDATLVRFCTISFTWVMMDASPIKRLDSKQNF